MIDNAVVIGTRPQYMKAIALLKYLSGTNIIVDTGQHYDYNMSKIFLEQLKFPKVVNLEVGSNTHGVQTARIIEGVEKILINMQPKIVTVVGDTNTTIGAALAAAKLQIPIAHIEAGCRAYDRSIAEEVNRVVADSVSSLLFTASMRHFATLLMEHQFGKAYNVGDILLDVLVMHFPHIKDTKTLETLKISKPYYVMTLHRDWNVDNPRIFTEILSALSESPVPIIYPIHPRPRKIIKEHGLEKYIGSQIRLIDPVSYYDMINLMRYSEVVITDSGGIQKEAFYLFKPCITLKEKLLEWQELVDCKATVLVGTTYERIVRALLKPPVFPTNPPAPYGDGTASEKIAKVIGEFT